MQCYQSYPCFCHVGDTTYTLKSVPQTFVLFIDRLSLILKSICECDFLTLNIVIKDIYIHWHSILICLNASVVTEEGFIKISTKPMAPSASEAPGQEEEGQDGQQSEEEMEGDDGPVFTSLQHFRAVSNKHPCSVSVLLASWEAFHEASCQWFSPTNLLSANQMQGF